MSLWVNTKNIKPIDKLTKSQREKIHINEIGTKRRLSQQPLRNSENLKDMLSKICAPHKKTKKMDKFLDIDDLLRINQDQISSLNRGQKVIKHLPTPDKILSGPDGSYLQGRINTN